MTAINPWKDAQHASRWRPGVIAGNPTRLLQLDLVEQILSVRPPTRILDLGCGSGEVARRLIERFDVDAYVGVDVQPEMLATASATLCNVSDGLDVRLVEAALESDWTADTGDDFDLVLGIQSVHHLIDADKRDLFGRVRTVLRAGGLFCLSELVAVPDPRLFAYHRALEDHARVEAGFDPHPPDLDDHDDHDDHHDDHDHDAHARRLASAGDRPATVRDQLAWLTDAGFDPVECFWCRGTRAILGGFAPADPGAAS